MRIEQRQSSVRMLARHVFFAIRQVCVRQIALHVRRLRIRDLHQPEDFERGLRITIALEIFADTLGRNLGEQLRLRIFFRASSSCCFTSAMPAMPPKLS